MAEQKKTKEQNINDPLSYAWANKSLLIALGLIGGYILLALIGAPTLGGLLGLVGVVMLIATIFLYLKVFVARSKSKK